MISPSSRFNPHRRHQDHLRENFRIGRNHLSRNKSARRVSNHIDRIELQLPHHLRIKSRQVPIRPHPLDLRRLPKPRLQRNQQRPLMRHRLIPRHPPRIPKLIMKNQHRLPRPTLDHDQLLARNIQSFLSRFDHSISPHLSPLPVRERMKVRVQLQRPARFRIPPLYPKRPRAAHAPLLSNRIPHSPFPAQTPKPVTHPKPSVTPDQPRHPRDKDRTEQPPRNNLHPQKRPQHSAIDAHIPSQHRAFARRFRARPPTKHRQPISRFLLPKRTLHNLCAHSEQSRNLESRTKKRALDKDPHLRSSPQRGEGEETRTKLHYRPRAQSSAPRATLRFSLGAGVTPAEGAGRGAPHLLRRAGDFSHQLSMYRYFFPVRASAGALDFNPAAIHLLDSAGSITSSTPKCDALLIAFPR